MFKYFNDVVRFILELTTLGLVAFAGFKANSIIVIILLGICLPICIIIFWSRYMAPQSPKRFTDFKRILTEIFLFGGAGFITYLVVDQKIAFIYLIVALINTVFDHAL
ncbi:YrdB family protein [Candidatus Enterococcus mansonii]|uniref:DUF2568 domain-containing protein n=1 Tax=Candidatus Enterococcus mansonii TaxID=1834181 RepID=A0A242CHR0_9ENTE|nr:YrdB family protein [Enterococcus sp. 4G2_DIV0659]OTO09783.1 hypothetical protein A5880_000465 [Enterococcus sp. 4G2_DIV0659]